MYVCVFIYLFVYYRDVNSSDFNLKFPKFVCSSQNLIFRHLFRHFRLFQTFSHRCSHTLVIMLFACNYYRICSFIIYCFFLCPRRRSLEGALCVAPVRPSVRPSVLPSVRPPNWFPHNNFKNLGRILDIFGM